MLIFHKLTDLDNVGDQGSAMRSLANSLLANAETRIVYRQESDQLGPTAAALGLTGTEQKLLPTSASARAVADQGPLVRRTASAPPGSHIFQEERE
jgi:hypothetical protein